MMSPVRPASAGAAVFAPVVDPSYADFLAKLKHAMDTINANYTGLWAQTTDPSSGRPISNSWTNNTHHIKVSAIQDSTSGQASLVFEPTDARKLTTPDAFANYFKNMFEVMAQTGNKYRLVSPGVENLLQGLANDSGADISLVREGLKAAIEDPDLKTKLEGCLHDSTSKAFEAQATLAPSAAASGAHGAGAATTAPGSTGAATTASGTTPSASVPAGGGMPGAASLMGGLPPAQPLNASGNGSGRDRALSL